MNLTGTIHFELFFCVFFTNFITYVSSFKAIINKVYDFEFNNEEKNEKNQENYKKASLKSFQNPNSPSMGLPIPNNNLNGKESPNTL